MQHLFGLGTLLINIDQETILRFLGIADPNVYATNMYTSPGSDLIDVPLSTQVSVETLKVIVQHYLDKYQNGFSIQDLKDTIYLITTIRFLIFSLRYNIITGAQIAGTSFVAAWVWLLHFNDVIRMYGFMANGHRLTKKLRMDVKTATRIAKFRLVDIRYVKFINQRPIPFLKSALSYASIKDGHRIDPVAMAFANLPDEYKAQGFKFYYKICYKFMPKFWKWFFMIFRQVKNLIIYSTFVRVNKKYCPYFVRWHWTYILVFNVFESEFSRLAFRITLYMNNVLIPAGREDEAVLAKTLVGVIISCNFLFLYFALFHAACGQYFYVPFITENTEIHIGPRPRNSIYSGGYTSWQEGIPKHIEFLARNKKRGYRFPRLWWGWFGNLKYTSDKDEKEWRKGEAKKIKKRVIKRIRRIIRKIRKWISRN